MPRKETSHAVSSLAARALREPETLTFDEIKTLAASVLSQDETPADPPWSPEDIEAAGE